MSAKPKAVSYEGNNENLDTSAKYQEAARTGKLSSTTGGDCLEKLPKPPLSESDLIFKGIQSLRNARKKLSPQGQVKLLAAINELFGV